MAFPQAAQALQSMDGLLDEVLLVILFIPIVQFRIRSVSMR